MTDSHPRLQMGRLYFVSALSLAMARINVSLRANTAGDLQRIFLDPIDSAHSSLGELLIALHIMTGRQHARL